MNSAQHKKTVEIIYSKNKLKDKVLGPNTSEVANFPMQVILKAESELTNHDPRLIAQEMDSLVKNTQYLRNNLKTHPEGTDHILTMIHIYSNRIIDLSSLCSFDLITHFATSLKHFLEEVDLTNPTHEVIIQAHIDVLKLANKNKIHKHNDPQALNLKHVLKQAIAQNTPQFEVAND